jgi:hypothetical protein
MPSDNEEPVIENIPLNDIQIEMAKIKIDSMHTIQTTPFGNAFPFLCCCFRLCKSMPKPVKENFESNLNTPLLEGREMTSLEKEQ